MDSTFFGFCGLKQSLGEQAIGENYHENYTCAIGKTWGFKPKVGYWIYTPVARPILTYAAVLWLKKIAQISVSHKIGCLQCLSCMYNRK